MPDIDPAMIPPELEDQVRCIQYDFGSDFLQLRTIGTQLTFSIGPHEVPNFRMIERHYFRNYLIRSFDFTFGFSPSSDQHMGGHLRAPRSRA